MWRKIGRCVPALGLGYIASFLEQKDYKVKIFDLAAENIDYKNLALRLINLRPRFIGLGATTVLIKQAIHLANICKEILPEAEIVLGGVHPSIFPEEALSFAWIDYIIRREGEFSLLELLAGNSPETIAGLSYKSGSKILHNPERPYIESLDSMPHPAYHLLPMRNYKPSTGNYRRLPAASIITSRGCPGRCTFCYTGTMGKRIRFRSAENILDEINLLIKDYEIKEINFYDDTFTANRQNVLRLCAALKKNKINISWTCMSRVDMVDSVLLKEMKSAGCHQIGYGIECADADVLTNINKHISPERVRKSVKETQGAGIDVRGMFMFGNPGETEETMEKTLRFAMSLNCDLAVFNITTSYPGTEMFNWAKKKRYLLTFDWEKYNLAQSVMQLPTVPAAKVESFYRLAYKRFYLRPAYIIRRVLKIRSLIDLWMDFRFFLSTIKEWLCKS